MNDNEVSPRNGNEAPVDGNEPSPVDGDRSPVNDNKGTPWDEHDASPTDGGETAPWNGSTRDERGSSAANGSGTAPWDENDLSAANGSGTASWDENDLSPANGSGTAPWDEAPWKTSAASTTNSNVAPRPKRKKWIKLWVIGTLVVLLVLTYFSMTAGRPIDMDQYVNYKYAHRGLHDEQYPENSIPACNAACEAGYGVEIDVHLSSDGEVVVFHDDTLDRMTGRSGKPEDFTAAELTSMQLEDTSYTIPLLKDVLDCVAGRTPLLIETKSKGSAGALEPAVYEVMESYNGPYLVQSFSPFSVGWFEKNAPTVPRGQLSSTFSDYDGDLPEYQRIAIRFLLVDFLDQPNFIAYGLQDNGLSSWTVRRLRNTGMPVFAWTVTSEEEYEQVAPYCDTIIFEGFRPPA